MSAARWWSAAWCFAVLGAFAAGCGSGPDGAADRASDPDGGGTDAELLVATSASLTDAFEAVGTAFSDRHPDVEVVLNIASSSTLAAQLLEGAPGDVFAAADHHQMQTVVDAGLAHDPLVFATNEVVVVVEPGNPLDIAGPADLAREDVTLVLADEQVPAGRYAAELLELWEVSVTPASYELDVRAVLAKIVAGEADAGIVYRSDVVSAGDRAEGIEIPGDGDVVAEYPIATLVGAEHPELAAAFVAFVRGEEGRDALGAAGFAPG